jgi:hypothetical protein
MSYIFQMLSDRWVVTWDIPLPHMETANQSVSAVLQDEAMAIFNSTDFSQDYLLRNTAQSTRYCVQGVGLESSSLPRLTHRFSGRDSVSHNSSMSEKSPEDKTAVVERKRQSTVSQTRGKWKRGSSTSKISGSMQQFARPRGAEADCSGESL